MPVCERLWFRGLAVFVMGGLGSPGVAVCEGGCGGCRNIDIWRRGGGGGGAGHCWQRWVGDDSAVKLERIK